MDQFSKLDIAIEQLDDIIFDIDISTLTKEQVREFLDERIKEIDEELKHNEDFIDRILLINERKDIMEYLKSEYPRKYTFNLVKEKRKLKNKKKK